MSHNDVALVRRTLEAFARGDLDTFLAGLATDVEWTTSADEPDPQTYRGFEGMRRFAAELDETWLDRFEGKMRFRDPVELEGWVVVPWTAAFEGRTSGVPAVVDETYAIRVEAGKIVRVREYRTEAEALAALSV